MFAEALRWLLARVAITGDAGDPIPLECRGKLGHHATWVAIGAREWREVDHRFEFGTVSDLTSAPTIMPMMRAGSSQEILAIVVDRIPVGEPGELRDWYLSVASWPGPADKRRVNGSRAGVRALPRARRALGRSFRAVFGAHLFTTCPEVNPQIAGIPPARRTHGGLWRIRRTTPTCSLRRRLSASPAPAISAEG
jgi:hypothetical protein